MNKYTDCMGYWLSWHEVKDNDSIDWGGFFLFFPFLILFGILLWAMSTPC